MAARLSPSQWLTASCSDPNTSDPPVWRRDQRGPDRQTARLAPYLSCQNRQAANRKEQENTPFKPFCLSIHALFPSDGFGIRQSPLSLHKLWSLICKGLGMWGSDWGITNQHWKRYIIHNFYSIAFYSILFSWPYVTGPLVGMCGDGNGRSVSGGERPHWGAVKPSTPGTTGLRSKAAWFMAYGLPHWGETVQFPHEDTADVVASGHASSCSVSTENIPDISFEWKFSDSFVCLFKVKRKL